MTRSLVVPPDMVRRVRRDARFRLALRYRIPDPGWRARGRCLQHDPEVFFPNPADDPSPALEICRTCEVRGTCLAAALDAGDYDGVWGATTPAERRAMRQLWRQPVAAPPR